MGAPSGRGLRQPGHVSVFRVQPLGFDVPPGQRSVYAKGYVRDVSEVSAALIINLRTHFFLLHRRRPRNCLHASLQSRLHRLLLKTQIRGSTLERTPLSYPYTYEHYSLEGLYPPQICRRLIKNRLNN